MGFAEFDRGGPVHTVVRDRLHTADVIGKVTEHILGRLRYMKYFRNGDAGDCGNRVSVNGHGRSLDLRLVNDSYLVVPLLRLLQHLLLNDLNLFFLRSQHYAICSTRGRP